MTYYELVKYLDSLIDKPIDMNNIEFLNNVDIHLDNERYQRFVDQLSYLITQRVSNVVEKFRDALITDYLDVNGLSLHASNYRNDIQYCLRLSKIALVQEADQVEFNASIISTNNIIVDSLVTFFEDEERQMIIKALYLKEDNNDIH